MTHSKIIDFVKCLLCFLIMSCNLGKEQKRMVLLESQIGTYILDTTKTSLTGYRDSFDKYKSLTITFSKDSFYLNQKVPFIFDSIGTWTVSEGGVEDWNWLYYKSNPNISTQFTEPWTTDSVFYLNSVTPQKGQVAINVIYFKKMK